MMVMKKSIIFMVRNGRIMKLRKCIQITMGHLRQWKLYSKWNADSFSSSDESDCDSILDVQWVYSTTGTYDPLSNVILHPHGESGYANNATM